MYINNEKLSTIDFTHFVVTDLPPNMLVEVGVDDGCEMLATAAPKIVAALVGVVVLLVKELNESGANTPFCADVSEFELSATFGLQILNVWNIDAGSADVVTVALEVVVTAVVAAVLPPNIDGAVPAFAKLNPPAVGFDVAADRGIAADVGARAEAAEVGVEVSDKVAAVCAVAGVLSNGVDAVEPPSENEKLFIELDLVIGIELATGVFSLSLFD